MAAETVQRRWDQALYRWLSAPLLITVVGALLVNFVIPQVTSKSQRQEKALEIETMLVREIGETVSRVVMTGQLVATDVVARAGESAQRVFNEGLRDWEIARAAVAAELAAYFPDTSLAADWNALARVVTDVYYLAATGVSDRCARVERIQRYLGVEAGCEARSSGDGVDWAALAGEERDLAYRVSYIAVDERILARAEQLVAAVLEERPHGL
jgi:hypothetical protein